MGFEINPADDVQPTKEEWEQYELIKDLQATLQRVRDLLAIWRRQAADTCDANHIGWGPANIIHELQAALGGDKEIFSNEPELGNYAAVNLRKG